MGENEAHDDLGAIRAELAALRGRVRALEAENERLRVVAEPPSALPPVGAEGPTVPDASASGRSQLTRRALLTGAAGAAATGVALVAGATPAAAVGSPVVLDGINTAFGTTSIDGSSGGTVVAVINNGSGAAVSGESVASDGLRGGSYVGTGVHGMSYGGSGVSGQAGNPSGLRLTAGVTGDALNGTAVAGTSGSGTGIIGVAGGRSGFTARAGVLGDATGSYGVAGFSSTNAGVRAASVSAAGINATSTNGVGVQAGGGRAALNLVPRSTTGRPTTGAHSRGDLIVDAAGTLYLCSASGTPGTWKKVTVTSA